MASLPDHINFSAPAASVQIAQLHDGNFVAVWTSFTAAMDGIVYGAVFRPDGKVLRPQFTVATAEKRHYTDVSVKTLTDGRTVIAFTEGGSVPSTVKAQILDVNHNLTSDVLSLGHPDVTDQGTPQIYALSNGGFSVLYSGKVGVESASFNAVWHPSSNGWERTIDETLPGGIALDHPSYSVIVLANGHYAITLAKTNNTDSAVATYVWSPGDLPPDGEFLDEIPGLNNIHPFLAPLDNNQFVSVWEDTSEQNGAPFIHAQVRDASSNNVGAEIHFSKPAGTIEKMVVTKLSNGGFAIALTVDNNGDTDVYAAACDANGAIVSDMAAVGQSTEDDQWQPSIIALANGSYAVSWMTDVTGGTNLVTQIFGTPGSPVDPTNPNNPNNPNNPSNPNGPNTIGTDGNDMLIAPNSNSILKGFGGHDSIMGGTGNDRLYGGTGNDHLTGGAGKDIFAFTTKPDKKKNLDFVGDYNVKFDTIWLDNAVFKKLGKGSETKPVKLKKDFFTIGKAKDANDFVLLDNKRGILSYDADGWGKGKAVEIVKFDPKPRLNYAEIYVI
jgi:uncharacterized protein (DUF2141 family)